MRDNLLIELVVATLRAGLTLRGLPGVAVKQAYQPRQQGADLGPGVYVHKLLDQRLGSVRRSYGPNASAAFTDGTEAQQMATTYQVMALWKIQDDDLTANDLCKIAAAIMQSDAGMQQLREADVGILRVGQVSGPFFVDDFGQNEASPSFDFVLTHKDIFTAPAPAVTVFEPAIHRV